MVNLAEEKKKKVWLAYEIIRIFQAQQSFNNITNISKTKNKKIKINRRLQIIFSSSIQSFIK